MSNSWNRALGIHAVLVACSVAYERVMTVLEIVVAPPAAGGVELGHDHRDVARGCGLASRRRQLAPARPCVSASRVAHGYEGRRETRQLSRDAPDRTFAPSRRSDERQRLRGVRPAAVTWHLRSNGPSRQRHKS